MPKTSHPAPWHFDCAKLRRPSQRALAEAESLADALDFIIDLEIIIQCGQEETLNEE
jgi:hypothetical protein